MNRGASGRAHGKVILLGEHAVVYGRPALAAGIERGAVAVATGGVESSCLSLRGQCLAPGEGELGRAFDALRRALEAAACRVELSTELPLGAGLGASAALGVATARALIEHSPFRGLGPEEKLTRVLSAADAWERVFHGNPSGIDAAAAAIGGCFLFSRAGGITPARLLTSLPLSIAVAGPPSSTRAMVERVASLRAVHPLALERSFDQIGDLVTRGREAVATGALEELGALLDRNQELLCGLGVSTPELERACEQARSAGALGSKLTGSGGGGSVLALSRTEDDARRIEAVWKEAGLVCFVSQVRSERPVD